MNSRKKFISILMIAVISTAVVPTSFSMEQKPSFFNKWGSRLFSGVYWTAGIGTSLSVIANYLQDKKTVKGILSDPLGEKDPEVLSFYHNTLKKVGIKNPEDIKIVYHIADDASIGDTIISLRPSRAGMIKMFIKNESAGDEFSESHFLSAASVKRAANDIQFILGHEARHIINKDAYNRTCLDTFVPLSLSILMRNLIKSPWKTPSTSKEFFTKNCSKLLLASAGFLTSTSLTSLYAVHRERQADREAAYLLDPEIVRAGAESFKKTHQDEIDHAPEAYAFAEKYPLAFYILTKHPLHTERILYLNKIADELEAQQKPTTVINNPLSK